MVELRLKELIEHNQLKWVEAKHKQIPQKGRNIVFFVLSISLVSEGQGDSLKGLKVSFLCPGQIWHLGREAFLYYEEWLQGLRLEYETG